MKIAVTITSYNQIKYLREAIDSVLQQTMQPDHLLIIDDNSNDGSQDLIKAYKENHPGLIDIILHEKNMGIIHARNEAITSCKGDLHTFLDGDDRFLDEKLEQEARLMEKNNYEVIVFGNVNYIDESGNKIFSWAEDVPPPSGDIFNQVFSRDFPKGSLFRSELVRTDIYREIGNYDPNLENLYEDFDMRIRISKQCRAVYCDRILSEYRLLPGGLSGVNKSKHLRILKYIFDKNTGLLDDLPSPERRAIIKKYMNLLGKMSLQASKEAMKSNKYAQATNFALDAINYTGKRLFI